MTCRSSTYFAQQITLSVLQRKHGLDPSHLVFLIRHQSQAFRTRLRILASDLCVGIRVGEAESLEDIGLAGDISSDWWSMEVQQSMTVVISGGSTICYQTYTSIYSCNE